MLIEFDKIQETMVCLHGGAGNIGSKVCAQPNAKIMLNRLPRGTSVGMHCHGDSSEFNYIISGEGKAWCDGNEEQLRAGVCHYCPKGSSHSICNTAEEDLVLFRIIAE